MLTLYSATLFIKASFTRNNFRSTKQIYPLQITHCELNFKNEFLI